MTSTLKALRALSDPVQRHGGARGQREGVGRRTLRATRGLEPQLAVGKSRAMRTAARNLPPVCSHAWIDLVQLALHRAIARKIRRAPELFNRARRTLARWEKSKRACPPSLREWQQILRDLDRDAVLRLLTRPDAEGQRLRSTAPFCDILTKPEVRAIWARYD